MFQGFRGERISSLAGPDALQNSKNADSYGEKR
jgi:hypothetical protein